MIVAGGYTTDRRMKPARTSIRNEAHNGLKNARGTIAMTRDPAAIDSATSQFFINLADAPQRDHQGDSADKYGYCVFGQVTEGLDIADKISQSPTTSSKRRPATNARPGGGHHGDSRRAIIRNSSALVRLPHKLERHLVGVRRKHAPIVLRAFAPDQAYNR